MRIVDAVTKSCKQALDTVKEKKRYYEDLLRICRKRIFDHKIKEFERIVTTSLVVNMPLQFDKIEKKIYNSSEKAKILFEEGYEGHISGVSSVAITSDNKYIVSGGSDNTVRIWNLQNKTQEAVLEGHTGSVSSVAITSDNKYIVSGGYDKTIRIWNFQERTQEAVWQGHTLYTFSVAITSDNIYIVSSGG